MADGTINVDMKTSASEASETPLTKQKLRHIARPTKAPRDVSQTQFPYVDQDAAISVARALLDAGGVALTRDQLAGAMNQTPGSGNFSWKVSAARLFGLIEQKDGKNQLTELGFDIMDDGRQKQARAQAFLNVPLYKRVYEEFRGKQLPPRPHGLEQAFVRFGVAPKQKDKARQAFERAARQAGFFEHGNERLVEPILGNTPLASSGTERFAGDQLTVERPASRSAPATQVRKSLHPFIEGLLETLPPPHSVWVPQEREKWLTTAKNIFELIYKTAPKAAPPVEEISPAQIGSASEEDESL